LAFYFHILEFLLFVYRYLGPIHDSFLAFYLVRCYVSYTVESASLNTLLLFIFYLRSTYIQGRASITRISPGQVPYITVNFYNFYHTLSCSSRPSSRNLFYMLICGF